MNITERTSGSITILDLKGKLLEGDGDKLFKRKVCDLLETGDNKIIINLAEVPYMDGGSLGEIVRCYTDVKRSNGELKLLNPNKRISDLLTITKLITVFEIFEDEAEAIASYS